MASVKVFTFNPFQENTYLVYDETNECVVFDPGCNNEIEREQMVAFITDNKLTPVKLINTHGHIDHMLGNSFVAGKYNLKLEMHKADANILRNALVVGQMYGVHVTPSPEPSHFLEEGDIVSFGNTKLQVFFTPGHSEGSISFYCQEDGFIIVGDVLFNGSIGRTDLPGGDFKALERSIRQKLYILPDVVKVYNGHGPSTTIGHEKKNNPFVAEK